MGLKGNTAGDLYVQVKIKGGRRPRDTEASTSMAGVNMK